MPTSDIVSITISVAQAGVARTGYGVPLVLGANMTGWGTSKIRFYTSSAAVAADPFDLTDPEYLMAASLFSQRPYKPRRIAIGKITAPTQRYDITAAQVVNSKTYTANVDGTDVPIDADSATSATEIATALAAALTALSNITATVVNTDHVRVVADAAGYWFSLKGVDASGVVGSDLTIIQDHGDPGVGTDLGLIALESSAWYYILNPWNSAAMAEAISDFAEANEKLFVCSMVDTDIANVVSASATDAVETFKDDAKGRTVAIFNPDPSDFNDAAWAGTMSTRPPGSATWQFKTLVGVTAPILTETQRTNLRAKKCNWYEDLGGVSGMQGGGVVSSGQFIDVVLGFDWFTSSLREDLVDLFLGADKVPMTNEGISQIQGVLDARLAAAVKAGVFAADSVSSSVPDVDDVESGDRAARHLPGVEFSARLAGAVHDVEVTGSVTA